MLQVEQTSHFDRDITKRYPTGAKLVSPSAQIDQIVVSAGTMILTRLCDANDLALMQVRLSSQKFLIEVPETGHGTEILVLSRTDEFKERFRSRQDGLKERITEVLNDIAIKEPL